MLLDFTERWEHVRAAREIQGMVSSVDLGELGIGQVAATGRRRSSMRAASAGKSRQGTDGVGGQACWPRLADADRVACGAARRRGRRAGWRGWAVGARGWAARRRGLRRAGSHVGGCGF